MDKLFEIIEVLADSGAPDAKYRDYDLTGNFKGTRECHVETDWLLIYEIRGMLLFECCIGLERILSCSESNFV
ncbi:MAG: type II toxin-antitoxin system YafQ family toxin [Bulleidia sp.]